MININKNITNGILLGNIGKDEEIPVIRDLDDNHIIGYIAPEFKYVSGEIKPTIVVDNLWALLPERSREFVLLHELGHYYNDDYDNEYIADEYTLNYISCEDATDAILHVGMILKSFMLGKGNLTADSEKLINDEFDKRIQNLKEKGGK